MSTKDTKTKNKEDQKELFANASIEGLREIAAYFGVHEDKIPEDATREQLIELLEAAKRHEIQIAKQVSYNGKELECPVGHMVIKVTPKNGFDAGNKNREVFFFAVQGQCIVGKRGVPLVVHEKYRSAWRDAIRYEYEMNGEPNPNFDPKPMVRTERFAEDVQEIFHNPDLEEAKRIEEELIAGSVKFQADKKAHSAIADAISKIVR